MESSEKPTVGCLSKTKSTTSSAITLSIYGKEVNKKEDIANHFNSYFTSVAHKLVEKLPPRPGFYGPEHIQDFYPKLGVTPNSFSFNLVSVEKISDMLKGLNTAKATGLDNISARFLKDASDLIAPYIAHIVNLSLEQGTVPDGLKHVKDWFLF